MEPHTCHGEVDVLPDLRLQHICVYCGEPTGPAFGQKRDDSIRPAEAWARVGDAWDDGPPVESGMYSTFRRAGEK